MSDADTPDPLLDAIAQRYAGAAPETDAVKTRPNAPKRSKSADSFTLSLTVDQDFRRRIRLLAARDNLSLVALIRAAIDLYERRTGTPKDL